MCNTFYELLRFYIIMLSSFCYFWYFLMEAKLVFALLVRVSSQQQGTHGHSLDTQRDQLITDVDYLGGEIYRIYEGVESAYKDDRPILDELLIDSKLKLFNAVMIYDLSRLARHTERAIILYNYFKTNDIRLFIRTQEFDPSSSEHKLIFSILSAINEHQSSIISEKAMAVKIKRAELGFPSTGELPFGRKCTNIKSKEDIPKWEIIQDKKAIADEIFNYYVNENKSYYAIAKLTGLHQATIKSILTEVAGEDWSITIHNKLYPIKVPALFSNEQIIQIQDAKAKHISSHGIYNEYTKFVLTGIVKCANCGRKMSSGQNQRGNRYYKHFHSPFVKPTDDCVANIPAPYLENIVLSHIGEIISSAEKLKESIENVSSNITYNEDSLISSIEKLKTRLNDEIKRKDRLVTSLANGLVSDEDVSKLMSEIRKNINLINNELIIKSNQLKLITSEYPKKFSSVVQNFFDLICQKEGRILKDWDINLQRQILKVFFGNATNKNLGIFVSKTGFKQYSYEIKGIIVSGHGNFKSDILESHLISEIGTWVNNATIDTPVDIESLAKVCELVTAWNPATSTSPAPPVRSGFPPASSSSPP